MRLLELADMVRGFDEINRLVVTDASVREVLVKEGELSAADELQLYTFANLYCNIWFTAQTAFESGQIDETVYNGAARDVHIELERFPQLRAQIQTWLERYPEVSGAPIFDPARGEG